MATVKIKFRTSSVPTREGAVFYQVIHGRVARQVNSGYKLYPNEWDAVNSKIIIPLDTENSRRSYLTSLKGILEKDIKRFKDIIVRFEWADRNYTAEEVTERFLTSPDSLGFIAFGRELVQQLMQIGKKQTAERYTTVLNSFGRFRKEKDVPLDEVDSNLMVGYEIFLNTNEVCPNTSSYYMRGLRAIYNRAVEKELTVQCNPFKHVYTGIGKTVKRAVPLKIIRQIKELDLTLFPAMDFARDIFMFSFYTRGMSFIDMSYLKKRNLQNGILSYRRQKTGQLLFIKWESPMQEIIDKYPANENGYLLPIIKTDRNERLQYRNALRLVNNKLKEISVSIGLQAKLTMYVSRHSWASIAKSQNIPLSVISAGMGHDSENTTQIYLASLDNSTIDKANDLILKKLR